MKKEQFEQMINNTKIGDKIEVKKRRSSVNYIWDNIWIPAKIVDIYPKYIVVEVLAHYNEKYGFGISRPYRITINTMELLLDEVEMRFII